VLIELLKEIKTTPYIVFTDLITEDEGSGADFEIIFI